MDSLLFWMHYYGEGPLLPVAPLIGAVLFETLWRGRGAEGATFSDRHIASSW